MKNNKKSFLFLILSGIIFMTFLAIPSNSFGQEKLVIAWPYKLDEVKPLCNYIGKKTGKKVEVVQLKKIKEIRNAFKNGTLDLCFMNGFGYVLLEGYKQIKIEPLTVLGKRDGTPNAYHSCIIAHSKTSVSTINELRKNAASLRLLFVKPTSTSGHLAPRLAFTALGLNSAEKDFQSVEFAGSHKKVIVGIRNRKADVGACARGELDFAIQRGDVSASEIKIIWTSGNIAEGPLVARENLDPKTKESVKKILINLNEENPKLWTEIHKNWSGAVEAYGFVEAKDSFYNPIRRTTKSLKQLLEVLDYYIN